MKTFTFVVQVASLDFPLMPDCKPVNLNIDLVKSFFR